MATIKNRLERLEKAQGSDTVVVHGIGWLYGDNSDVTTMTRKQLRARAERGLAAFYEETEGGGDLPIQETGGEK